VHTGIPYTTVVHILFFNSSGSGLLLVDRLNNTIIVLLYVLS
jgi:hypothetical protein